MRMREFSMFFQAVLSVLGVVAVIMMNLIIDRMDTYGENQQALTVTVAAFMATTTNDISNIKENQTLFGSTQRERTSTFDRAKSHFESADKRRALSHD